MEHTGVLCRQRQHEMIDIIAREDGQRPRGRQAAIEQRLRDAAHARERGGVGEPDEMAVLAPREQRAIGRRRRPVDETIRNRTRIRAERTRRAHAHDAVLAVVDYRMQIAEPHRTIGHRWL